MSTTTTIAPRVLAHAERAIAPVTLLRSEGDVCPQARLREAGPSVAAATIAGIGHGFGFVKNDRFMGTPVWSPPDR